MNKLPAPLALRKYIVLEANSQAYQGFNYSGPLDTEEQIDEAYDYTIENDGWGIEDEIRQGQEEISIKPPYSRNYEAKSVATKTQDGWIGWTYWYGGGKYGNPEEINWIDDAYYLNCKEKEVLRIEKTWTKINPQ